MFVKLENVSTTLCPQKGIVNVTVGLKVANLSQKVLTCMLSQEPLAERYQIGISISLKQDQGLIRCW